LFLLDNPLTYLAHEILSVCLMDVKSILSVAI
jgi:hypothetical protein